MRWYSMDNLNIPQSDMANLWVRRITGRPAWVWKLSIFAGGLVLAPVLILALVAVALAAGVFLIVLTVLTWIARLCDLVTGRGRADTQLPDRPIDPDDAMRDNVKVVDWR